MPRITAGNKLYLYQLLSRELGMGKQALLPRVEEVLAADDILPEDLECSDVQQLVEACSDFIKVTVFKKGRVFATVVRNPDWDKQLSASAQAPEQAPKTGKGGKPWKAKSTGKKGTKPAKPRNKERKLREAREAEERARVEAEAQARAEAERKARAEQEAAERAAAEQKAVEQAQAAVAEEATAQEEPSQEAAEASSLPSLSEQIKRERERLGIVDEPKAPAKEQPVPKPAVRRRVGRFASALSQDAALRNAPQEGSKRTGGKADSRASQSSTQGNVDEQGVGRTSDDAGSGGIPRLAQDDTSKKGAQDDTGSALSDTNKKGTQNCADEEPVQSKVEVSAAAPGDLPDSKEPAASEPSIKLTITFDPDEQKTEPESAQPTRSATPRRRHTQAQTTTPQPNKPLVRAEEFEHNSLPARPARRVHHTQASPVPPATADLPENFSTDVHSRDDVLRMLYQMLPIDADVARVLEEDWRVARSTSTVSGTRAKVTFPLRYLHEDGTPVEVTLRRASKQAAGKKWNLAYVDGDDGSGRSHAAVGLEGLPAADEGAWTDLSGRDHNDLSPSRELAQFAVLGTWDAMLGGLASKAEPERWNYPGEGVGRERRLSILREYLSVTFHRANRQKLVAIDPDETFAAFNTGLLTPFAQDIYACFVPHRGDIPWSLAGFATVGAGELGGQLVSSLPSLPDAPSYLSSVDDVVARSSRTVVLDTEALLSRRLGRLPRAFLAEQLESNTIAREVLEQELAGGALDRASLDVLSRTIKGDPGLYRRMSRAFVDAVELALRRAERSYRIAAPVYDPSDNRVKLLVPLCLVNDAKVDCAAVLDLQRSGAYRVASVLPLERAYACARVVSAEMPSWLAAEKVL